MKAYLGVCLLILSSVVAAQTLYKVVDKDGNITYTDRPQNGAEPIDLTGVNTAIMPGLAKPKPRARVIRSPEPQLPDYVLKFTSPTNEQTVRDNSGNVTISAALSPNAGGTFQLYLNGALYESGPAPSFRLEGLDRGAHTIEMKFLHNSGKILASTQKQVFYLHRASALINAN